MPKSVTLPAKAYLVACSLLECYNHAYHVMNRVTLLKYTLRMQYKPLKNIEKDCIRLRHTCICRPRMVAYAGTILYDTCGLPKCETLKNLTH